MSNSFNLGVKETQTLGCIVQHALSIYKSTLERISAIEDMLTFACAPIQDLIRSGKIQVYFGTSVTYGDTSLLQIANPHALCIFTPSSLPRNVHHFDLWMSEVGN